MMLTSHKNKLPSRDKLEAISAELLKHTQADCPVVHGFGPGVYLRQLTIPADVVIIGKHHKHEHTNIMVKGRMLLLTDGGVVEAKAPLTMIGKPGQKVAYAIEETVWINVHATNETDIEKLEDLLYEKSGALESTNQARLAFEQVQHAADRADFDDFLSESGLKPELVRKLSENTEDQISMPRMAGCRFQVADSPIEGKGVFASANIPEGFVIGMCRIRVGKDLKRTPLGRFINHSKKPNCKMVEVENGDVEIVATRSILGAKGGLLGDEIVLDYRHCLAVIGKNFKDKI